MLTDLPRTLDPGQTPILILWRNMANFVVKGRIEIRPYIVGFVMVGAVA